jgi:hypothetical protein
MIYTQGGLSTESGQFQSLFMAGLICLKHETKLAAALRVRVITVSGNPRAVMLQQQFSSSGYAEGGHPEMYNMTDFRFFPSLPALGFGLQALVQTENAGALIGIGSHDLSSHIPAFESATAQGALTISCELWASDISSSSLVCDYTILQEEAMAAAAYLSTDEATRASIMGQDLFKIINVVILITLAVVFTTSGLKLF